MKIPIVHMIIRSIKFAYKVSVLAKKASFPLDFGGRNADRELSQRLKISRRTLQDYRNNGILPYRQLGGKILYRESDIERVLQRCCHGKF